MSESVRDRIARAGSEDAMSGWAETPGGGLLARLIGEAFARANDERDEQVDD